MIFYNPLDGDPATSTISGKPRTCFLVTQLGANAPTELKTMRQAVRQGLVRRKFRLVDASGEVTGRDFLLKIWKMIFSVPLVVGLFHQDMPVKTQLNIFYELGVAQAMGKETVIVKAAQSVIPSDFVRTEYIEHKASFSNMFDKFIDNILERADHYETTAEQLEKNPLLALDYLKRAYLITGAPRLRKQARRILAGANLTERAQNSVEILAAHF